MKENSVYEQYKGDIAKTISYAYKMGAQDVLLMEGERPRFKIKGVNTPMPNLPEWTRKTFDTFLLMTQPMELGENVEYTTEEEREIMIAKIKDTKVEKGGVFDKIIALKKGSHDFNLASGSSRLRCHMYSAFPKGIEEGNDYRPIQAVINIRIVPNKVPKLETLNLPNIAPIFNKKNGLFLVSGNTGDGKSTTVASIINEINHMSERANVILTLEDPVEFVHANINSWIIHRRIGENVESYAKATEDALREDADIVVIGELRKAEEMHNALRLAEVGKLVIATIHAKGVEDTIERYVNEFNFEEREQVRSRLKESLIGILHQNLISVSNEQYPLVSLMMVDNETHRNILRENGERSKLDRSLKKFGEYGITREEGFNKLEKMGVVSDKQRKLYL